LLAADLVMAVADMAVEGMAAAERAGSVLKSNLALNN